VDPQDRSHEPHAPRLSPDPLFRLGQIAGRPGQENDDRAARKPIAAWSAADLGLDAGQVGASGSRRAVERLYIPTSEIVCEFVPGAAADEMARNLARRLFEAKVL
jgi:electron transfer flavoprotein alpha/beta subunit